VTDEQSKDNALTPSQPQSLTRRSAALVRRGLESLSTENVVKNSLGMEFTLIPEGSFMMGSDTNEDEKPIHKVIIRKPFYLGKYPVIQSHWRQVMGNNPSKSVGDTSPVHCVSWDDVQEFIRKLNILDDQFEYRLPSEAEWEYACRSESTAEYAGDLDLMGWYYGSDSLHPVGEKQPNAFGLFDMHGGVEEWCEDRYHLSYEGAPANETAWVAGGEIAEETNRVSRGGCYLAIGMACRSASRGMTAPWSRGLALGCRVVAVKKKIDNTYDNRGLAKYHKGDYDGAIADFTRAIEIDPRDATAYANRGGAKWSKRDLDGAISDCTKAIEINPRSAAAYTNRGGAKWSKNDFDGAIVDCTRAIEIDPSYAEAYYHRGLAKRRKDDVNGAIADYTKAIEIDPRFASAYSSRGFAKQEKGDLDGAIADFSKDIEINPRHASAYDSRGHARQRKGDLDGAIADYTKAVELDPRYPLAYYNRGVAKREKGDLDGAMADFNKSDEIAY
jgi:formylglycine-generating enzyme required for sulfatase activity/Flp pilus assembly protein TadD